MPVLVSTAAPLGLPPVGIVATGGVNSSAALSWAVVSVVVVTPAAMMPVMATRRGMRLLFMVACDLLDSRVLRRPAKPAEPSGSDRSHARRRSLAPRAWPQV